MTLKKLTPKQKEILQTLKDNPQAVLSYGWIGSSWHLLPGEHDWESAHTIRTDLVDERIRTFLTKLPYNGRQTDRYTIHPDAEITDEWLQAKIAANHAEREAKHQVEEDAKERTYQEMVARISVLNEQLQKTCRFKTEQNGSNILIRFNGKSYLVTEQK